MPSWYKKKKPLEKGDPGFDYQIDVVKEHLAQGGDPPKPGSYAYNVYLHVLDLQKQEEAGNTEPATNLRGTIRERSDTAETEDIDMTKVTSPANKKLRGEPTMEPAAKNTATIAPNR